jgi:translation initiation factor 2 subunit 1
MKDIPEYDELVIATIKKIFPYGAFCYLEEYNKEGFIHISEVAPRWIKNIHNFLKEGQRVVGRVYRIVPEKNLIDISLKRVSDADQIRKLESFKRNKRVVKLLEVAKAKTKKTTKLTIEEVRSKLEQTYGDSYLAFELAAAEGIEGLKKAELPEDWATAIAEVAKDNIKKQKRIITGVLSLQSTQSNGIEIIKSALNITNAEFIYLGAPNYMISVESDDYKKCEKRMKQIVDEVAKVVEKSGGTCKFERKEE